MKNHKKETFWAYLCSAPSLLLILLIVVFPILYTAYISFTNMNVYHWFNFSFVGLQNYKDALFVFDSGFLAALLRTILWTVLNMVLQLVIAFVLASLLNIQNFKTIPEGMIRFRLLCGDFSFVTFLLIFKNLVVFWPFNWVRI